MNKKQESEVIRLTQECLNRYWKLDMEYALEMMDDDVTWVGAEQQEFLHGIDAVRANFDELLLSLRSCHLLNQEFIVTQNCGKTCAVTGRYLVTTDDENEYFLQAQQRCTFIWELKKDKYKIKHIHVSNPMGELKIKKGERFVNTMGKMAKQYLENKINSVIDKSQITVNDINGATRFVYLTEIMYVYSDKNDTILHTINEEIRFRMRISEFSKQLNKNFIHVHRSYIININYMEKMERYNITMKDGSIIPVPVKKYNKLREFMTNIHNKGYL